MKVMITKDEGIERKTYIDKQGNGIMLKQDKDYIWIAKDDIKNFMHLLNEESRE